MKKILLCTLLTLLCFNTANATWTVKELSDNQIAAYVLGEANLYNRVIFFFRKENCSKPAHYFVLNTKSSKEEHDTIRLMHDLDMSGVTWSMNTPSETDRQETIKGLKNTDKDITRYFSFLSSISNILFWRVEVNQANCFSLQKKVPVQKSATNFLCWCFAFS